MNTLIKTTRSVLRNFSKYIARLPKSATGSRDLHNDDTENVEDDDGFELYEEAPVFDRNVLYPESRDPVIRSLINCTSVQQVLDVVRINRDYLSCQHVTQAIITVWDLVKALHHLDGIPESRENVRSNSFVVQLHEHVDFGCLLSSVGNNIQDFNATDLSYVYLYLNKLGVDEKHELIRFMMESLKKKLVEDFSLSAVSRFIVTVFSEYDLKRYFNVLHLVPLVLSKIDECQTSEEIKYLTVCLNNLYEFLTKETLQKYKTKVSEMIDNSQLTAEDHKTLLKILIFLNHPKHRHENIEMIRTCCTLIKNKISEMTAPEICLLFDVFQRNQESAEIFDEIRRNATKHFLRMEEESDPSVHVRLNLLLALVSLASPHQRQQYHRTVARFAKENLHPGALFILQRILSNLKTSDRSFCNHLWDQIHKSVASSEDRNLLKLIGYYSNFNVDIANFRHVKFENLLNLIIDRELERGILRLLPSAMAHVSLFYLPYCSSRKKVEAFVGALCENWCQLSANDWLKISKAVQTARESTFNKALKREDCVKIEKACYFYVMTNIGTLDFTSINLLLKSYILRGETNSRLVDYLVIATSGDAVVSSNLIKNTIYCFKNTSSYLPEVLDEMCEYICENRSHVLGTTVEKYLHFCYFADYHPKTAEFFEAATDIIIRDRERMNGLTFLQAGLSLCYFNRLPHSIIKQIFNVGFLEKLDAELAACYSKETYPLRVRHTMMQLNRAVCLDHPEANVPWFHEKYVEERKATRTPRSGQDHLYHLQVREALLELAGAGDEVKRNVEAPYGYFVDFVVTAGGAGEIGRRVALVLVGQKAYMRSHGRLKGQYLLKKRHLEILGFRVVFVGLREWLSVGSNKERAGCLKRLVWPDKSEKYAANVDR